MTRLAAVVLVLASASPLAADLVRVTGRDPQGRVVRTEDFSDGVPVWETTYDPETGLAVSENSYRDGGPGESAQLHWSGTLLTGRTVRAADGGLLFEETLWHWPDGRLRRAQRTGADGAVSDTAWTYSAGGKLAGAWTTEGPEGHREWSFGSGKTEQKLFQGPEEVLRRVTDRAGDGTSVETIEVPGEGRVTVTAWDDRHRPLTETVTVGGQPVSVRRWTYDPAGRPASLEVTTGGRTDRREYRYPDDRTEVTLWSRAGQVYREETRVEGDLTQTRWFDKGRLFLAEAYQDGRPILETYYQDGKAVRERKR